MKKEKLIDRAQKYIQKGYLDKAIADYRAVAETDPTDISLRLRLGDLCVKANRKEDAIKEYNEVAKIYAQKGFYLKAIAVYKQVMKLDETNLEVRYKLADLYTKQRLIVDAIGEYSHIVSFFEKKEKNLDVLELLKKMVSIDPENAGLRLKLADMHRRLGYTEDALNEHCWVANKLLGQNKLDKAEKILLELYKTHPREERVLDCLCELYRKKGEALPALFYARALLDVYTEKGDEEGVKAVSAVIIEIDPRYEKARDVVKKTGAGQAAKAPQAPGKEPPGKVEAEEEPVTSVAEPEGAEPSGGKAKEAPSSPPRGREEVETPSEAAEKEELFEVLVEEEGFEVLEPIEVVEEVTEEAAKEGGVPGKGRLETGAGEGPSAIPEITGESWEEEGKEDFVDLSKELGIEEAVDRLVGMLGEGEEKETVEEIKAGMGERLGREDAETHHNMGKAYMEMELYGDAVREFKISVQDPLFEFDAYTRLGICSIATGAIDDAISYYLKALRIEGRSEEERMGLLYELGLAYEATGNELEAGEMFRAVYAIDPGYREVADKVREFAVEADIPRDDNMIEVEIL